MKIKILFAALAVAMLTASCNDGGNDGSGSNYQTPAAFAFLDKPDISTSLAKEKYTLTVLKSGETQGAVKLAASDAVIEAYNELHGTEYVAIPSNLYSLSQTSLDFAAGETRKSAEITWNGGEIKTLDPDREYAIAVQLSSDDPAAVSDIRNFVILRPAATTIRFDQSIVAGYAAASREAAPVAASVSMNNPEDMDITVNYSIDNALVAEYNAANGTSYVAAPSSLVTLGSGSSVIPAGALSTAAPLQITSAGLFDGNTLKAVDDNKYLVPLRILSLSSDAILIANDVVYVTVDLNRQLTGPWTVLEGADQCLALDPVPEPYNVSNYTVDKLFNGAWGAEADVWASYWNTRNQFPMTFVADMGVARVFTKFRVADAASYQGQLRNYEIYTAETYDGASTKWNLVASGMRGYDWVPGGGVYDYPVQKMIAGRYLKFVVMNHERAEANWTGDFVNGRCKLAEVFGMGF